MSIMTRLVLAGIACAAASSALAADPTNLPPAHRWPSEIIMPGVLRWPDPATLAHLYPDGANTDGKTVIECEVTIRGELNGCAVVSEDPPDKGFGAAALAAARYFTMIPRLDDGHPVGGARVRIPLVWKAQSEPKE